MDFDMKEPLNSFTVIHFAIKLPADKGSTVIHNRPIA